MSDRTKLLRLVADFFEFSEENQARFFFHVSREATAGEAKLWSDALLSAPNGERNPETQFVIGSIDRLFNLVTKAQDEKEKVKLAMLYLEATDRDSAMPGRAINKVLPEEVTCKSIRTPLGRLIQDKEVIEVPSAKDNGHPSYFLTLDGRKIASKLARELSGS